jgi:hypothetical protein
MHRGIAVIAALAVCAAPAMAQGKTKPGAVGPAAIQIVEICEAFARGDVLATDDAIALGWDAYAGEGESPYIRTFNAHKELPGIGLADLFVLFEDYPASTLGYCRMDVIEPAGNRGLEAIQAIQNLDRYEGTSQQVSEGNFASLTGVDDPNRMLLAHWNAEAFVIQLTIITEKSGPAD